jgi:tryptophanyl-tRNA synthetase
MVLRSVGLPLEGIALILGVDRILDMCRTIVNITGGCSTVQEQRAKGGNPDVCSVYAYFNFIFEPDDAKLATIRDECTGGKVMCGDCKQKLAERVGKWLEVHQEKRGKAKDVIEKFMLRD